MARRVLHITTLSLEWRSNNVYDISLEVRFSPSLQLRYLISVSHQLDEAQRKLSHVLNQEVGKTLIHDIHLTLLRITDVRVSPVCIIRTFLELPDE